MKRVSRNHFTKQHSSAYMGTWTWKELFTCLVVVCAFIYLFIGISSAATATDENTPLAIGKGIVITKGDLDNFKRYMEKRKFSSTDAQHLKVLIRITLFAAEAEKLGLGGGKTFNSKEYGKVQKTLWLSESYLEKLKSEYPVSEAVIESYYFSHPEKFLIKDGGEPSIGVEQKEEIRKIVRNAKRPEIAKKAFENLKREYQIELVGGKGK